MTKKDILFCILGVLILYSVFVAVAFATTPTIEEMNEKCGAIQHYYLDLPEDFNTAISVVNNKNGVVVGYLDENGKLFAVQYSGRKYEHSYKFHFAREE